MCKYKLISDFTDYYDCRNDTSLFIYKRMKSANSQRGSLLKQLRSYGIKTVEIKQVSQAMSWEKVVVYKDINSDKCKNKTVMDIWEAVETYPNLLCSKYIESDTHIKYIQIGNIGYRLVLDVDTTGDIKLNGIKSIEAIQSDYTAVGVPIYSINYVVDNNAMIATKFNQVQELSYLGFENIIGKEQINELIYKSLLTYNKQAR